MEAEQGEAKKVMSLVTRVVEEVALTIEATTKKMKDEGKEISLKGLDLPIIEVSKVDLAVAKAEEDLGQMIAVVSDIKSTVKKMWDLHQAYRYMWIGCTQGLNVYSVHTVKGTRNSIIL